MKYRKQSNLTSSGHPGTYYKINANSCNLHNHIIIFLLQSNVGIPSYWGQKFIMGGAQNPWIGCVEELETLPAGTKPRRPHHEMPGRDNCWRRKCSIIFFERIRKDYHQSDKYWNCFKMHLWVNFWEMGGKLKRTFSFTCAWIPSGTELKPSWSGFCSSPWDTTTTTYSYS